MRVLVAGATGAVGVPTVRALVAAGHTVGGMTRSPAKREMIEALGASPVVADALDPAAVRAAVDAAEPEAVVQLLTALPSMGPTRPSHLRETNRLRTRGTAILLDAARGATRYVSESIVLGYGYGRSERVLTEDDPFAEPPYAEGFAHALAALAEQERLVLAHPGGTSLRFGLFYGFGSGGTDGMAQLLKRGLPAVPAGAERGVLPFVHIEDVASAVVAALATDASRGRAYNIVDDEPASFADLAATIASSIGARRPRAIPRAIVTAAAPYASAVTMLQLRVSNARAKAELAWEPRYPSIREGLARAG